MPDDTEITEQEQTEDEDHFDDAFVESAKEAGSGKKFEFVEPDEPKTEEEKEAAKAKLEAEDKAKAEKEAKEAEEAKAAEEKAKLEKETEEETKARKEAEAEAKAEEEKKAGEEDEVEKRGKELLEAEEKAKKEKEETDAKETAEAKAAEKETAKAAPVSKDLATALSSLLADEEVSESIEVNGVEVNLKQYFEDFPEAKIASALMAKKVVERLVDRNVLMSRAGYEEDMAGVVDLVQDIHFELRVAQLLPDYEDIVESKEFEALAEKASPAIKALLASSTPKDFVDAVKKLTGKDKPKEEKETKVQKIAREKKEEAQKIAKEKKDRHDRLHGGAGKSSSGPGGDISPTVDEDDYDASFDEAASEALKKE